MNDAVTVSDTTHPSSIKSTRIDTPRRVGFSWTRIWIIGTNTFTEAARQKVYNILLIFALIVIASASFFAQFGFGEQLKFIKDFCLGALSVFGMLIAILGTAQLLPNELENRTIYTILSKPVRRFEFLLGKYMGSLLLIMMSVFVMSLLFVLALKFKEHRLIKEVRWSEGAAHMDADDNGESLMIQQIRATASDPDIYKGIFLIFIKLALLASITLLVSTVSTSMVFNVTVAVMAFFAGSLVGTAQEMWTDHRFLVAALSVIPDLGTFNLADDIILGNTVPWSHVGKVALDGVIRIVSLVVASHFLFAKREI